MTVEIYDPKPDSEEEEWAVTYGMKSIQLPTGENFYLGLVAMAADREAAIPFIDPTKETQLEYDLTRIISRVQTAKRLKIAILQRPACFRSAVQEHGHGSPVPVPSPGSSSRN